MSDRKANLSNHIGITGRFIAALLLCMVISFAHHSVYAEDIIITGNPIPGITPGDISNSGNNIPGINDISGIIGTTVPDMNNISGTIANSIGMGIPGDIGNYGTVTNDILTEMGLDFPAIPTTPPGTPSGLISIFDTVAGTDIGSQITTAANTVAGELFDTLPTLSGFDNSTLGNITSVGQLGDIISNLSGFSDIGTIFSDTVGSSLSSLTNNAITQAGSAITSPITDAISTIASDAASTFGAAASSATSAFGNLTSATNTALTNISGPGPGPSPGPGPGPITCPAFSPAVHAAIANGDLCTADTCGNTTPTFDLTNTSIISDIITKIKSKIYNISFKLYNGILLDIGFRQAISSALALYVAIYGILFMTGMVPIKLYDFMIRLIKIGIISALISPTSWLFFSDTVVRFFDGGTDDIINFATNNALGISLGGLSDLQTAGSPVFSALDAAFSKVVSAKMFVTLLATAVDPNYGPIMFLLMLASIWSFIRSVLTAMWVYIMSTVMKALLFGLAPIFIPTILFARTRHIFDGWINQLINASLQPILLFMFFLFFVRLMEGSIDTILSNPICFSKFPEGWRGSSFEFFYWRFMEHTSNGWVPNLDDFKLSKGFAVSQVAILTFLLIAEIANRFNSVVISIAGQLAQASTSFHGVENPLSGAMHAASRGTGAIPGMTGNPVGGNFWRGK